eukprot:gnl/MRDRNA2_/MRDRNA2_18915_c0_seq1.p1 gnl/MRDRNA2_/MRDRNA2_18915_c0~~gnl/MRDRNA2_/MRDRNA2_18915_c0_seq1.p1  ORF type:complete len:262 (+),score=43.36 gnl/MRDRNA2_/MRDRNA2_18915_c0_seq1:69-854(+)
MTWNADLAIDVRTMAGVLVSVTLDYKSTIADLKLAIEDALLVPPEAQKLCCGDRVLSDTERLSLHRPFNAKAIEMTLVAAQKVSEVSEVGAVRKQIARLRSNDSHVRDVAVKELVRLVGRDSCACFYMVKHALTELIRCLPFADSKSRRSVIEALSQVAPKDHEESISAMVHALSDASEWVRLSAADLLPKVVTPGNEFAMEKLQGILRNRRVEVRAVGLLALSGVAQRGDERTISILSECCDDKNDYIKSVAFDALQKVL